MNFLGRIDNRVEAGFRTRAPYRELSLPVHVYVVCNSVCQYMCM